MLPTTQPARSLFLTLMIAAALALLASLALTLWSQSGAEGWVAKAVIAFGSWFVSIPLVAAALIWLAARWRGTRAH